MCAVRGHSELAEDGAATGFVTRGTDALFDKGGWVCSTRLSGLLMLGEERPDHSAACRISLDRIDQDLIDGCVVVHGRGSIVVLCHGSGRCGV